jgi:uncharacterized membrane protein
MLLLSLYTLQLLVSTVELIKLLFTMFFPETKTDDLDKIELEGYEFKMKKYIWTKTDMVTILLISLTMRP